MNINSIQYYLVDVFSDNKYGGNQLAVFVDYDNIVSDSEMLAIARELNFAEITFIKKNFNNEKFKVRIFTPEYEVPFAGHPSLGTAYVISKYLISKTREKIVLELNYADIEIQLNDLKNLSNCLFTMKQAQPIFYKTYEYKKLAEELNLPISIFNTSKKIEEVTTGLPYIIVAIKNIEALNSISLEANLYESFLLNNNLHKSNNPSKLSTSLYFVTDETLNSDFNYHSRMLLLEQGVVIEDAATGSANGCFLAYLLKNESEKVNIAIEQGYKMGRKSHLYLDGKRIKNNYQIYVSGKVTEVGSGLWNIS